MGNEESKPQTLYRRISKALPPVAPQYGNNENSDWVDKGAKAFASDGDRDQFICEYLSFTSNDTQSTPLRIPFTCTATVETTPPIKLTHSDHRRPNLPPNLQRLPQPRRSRHQALLLAPPIRRDSHPIDSARVGDETRLAPAHARLALRTRRRHPRARNARRYRRDGRD